MNYKEMKMFVIFLYGLRQVFLMGYIVCTSTSRANRMDGVRAKQIRAAVMLSRPPTMQNCGTSTFKSFKTRFLL
uniref:Uncharacterized protein n=1 Tax=Anguilla anguilla TaxID=7936 RepID=A0A0E9WQ25_ANGAN